MKNSKRGFKKYYLILFLVFPLQGCLDIFLTTEIHPNGQIDKTIVLEGDSAAILDSYIPAASNTTWNSEWVKVDDEKHKLILSKSFNNELDLNEDLNPDDSLPAIRIKANLKRKFRWFFSYLSYEEFLLPNNPFTKLDWKEYLTDDEIEILCMDEEVRKEDIRYDDEAFESIEKKFEDYVSRSAFEEFYTLFYQAVDENSSTTIKLNELEKNKEEIYQYVLRETDFTEPEDLLISLNKKLGEDRVKTITDKSPEILEYFNSKFDFFDKCSDDNYHFTIRMPGLLVESNSNKIEGSSLSWDVDFFDFYFYGMTMRAESRILNNWAFIVAGIVILFLLFGMSWNLFQQRRRTK